MFFVDDATMGALRKALESDKDLLGKIQPVSKKSFLEGLESNIYEYAHDTILYVKKESDLDALVRNYVSDFFIEDTAYLGAMLVYLTDGDEVSESDTINQWYNLGFTGDEINKSLARARLEGHAKNYITEKFNLNFGSNSQN